MDGANDISKIIGLIMENPEIIEKIRSLADAKREEEAVSAEPVSEARESIAEEASETKPEPEAEPAAAEPDKATYRRRRDKKRRHDLLCALKPYVSGERGRAIDTMLSFIDVFDIMKER